jgi:hypothetical protein
MAGDAARGVVKTFDGFHDRQHTASASYAGPGR